MKNTWANFTHVIQTRLLKKVYAIKLNDKKDNPWFYEEVAKIINRANVEIPCVYFDIREYNSFCATIKKKMTKS